MRVDWGFVEVLGVGALIAVAALPFRPARESTWLWFAAVLCFWPLLGLLALKDALKVYWRRWRDFLTD